MKIFNSLTRRIEEFVPVQDDRVGVYTCGPTVYSFVTIGNWRTYVLGDLLVRTLNYLKYSTDYVMNITDVGHLTGDNQGDADTGEDRLEKAAVKEGRTAWDIAKYYTDNFYQGYEKLNLTKPKIWCKATDHISEQITMIQTILDQGFTYQTIDGIYFDTNAYEKAGHQFGELSNLKDAKIQARVEPNPNKKDPRDFALWKFSPPNQQRQMEWNSPWGIGFPGWHIECSAMSVKYLGEQFDIHIGGEDLRSTHHPNEIVQAEAVTGKKPFVKYWVHGAFLLVDGGRMGKSLGNAYTLDNLAKKGFSAIDLRYFYLTGHYRKQLNFTFTALASAKAALTSLKNYIISFKAAPDQRTVLSTEKLTKINHFKQQFINTISNDLNLPESLAVVWEVIKSNIPNIDKYDLIIDFDQVLGLGLSNLDLNTLIIPADIQELIDKRNQARLNQDFTTADIIRNQIIAKGYIIYDQKEGYYVQKKP